MFCRREQLCANLIQAFKIFNTPQEVNAEASIVQPLSAPSVTSFEPSNQLTLAEEDDDEMGDGVALGEFYILPEKQEILYDIYILSIYLFKLQNI